MTRPFKSRLRAQEQLAGCFVMAPSPSIVEMCGFAGFDFVVIDQEHGPAGTETLENMVRAAEASGTAALVRVPWGDRWLIQRALDAGAQGVVVPHVTSAEEARAIVRACHYPPLGYRGLASTARGGRHGNVALDQHLRNGAERVTVIVQIEDREALPHVMEIAAIEGVDSLFIGPADLSASLGQPGNFGHPDVAAAIDAIIADARAAGNAVVSCFVKDADDAAANWQRPGRDVRVLVLSTVSIFAAALRGLAARLVKPGESK
ncbi:MAG: aldolase/citrate lyase family protein [Paracoccaceae bacterium]